MADTETIDKAKVYKREMHQENWDINTYWAKDINED